VTVCAGISGTVNDLLSSHAGQDTKKEFKKSVFRFLMELLINSWSFFSDAALYKQEAFSKNVTVSPP
jgi:hypothetical protein